MIVLERDIIKAIQEVVKEKREQNLSTQSLVIREGIFDLLEKNCTVFYYPVQDNKNCGFHTKRFVKDGLMHFVYINTAKPLSEQVFAAAHELGHVWGIAKEVMAKIGSQQEISVELEEAIVNRFAAELLMPEDFFVATFNLYKEKFVGEEETFSIAEMAHIIVMQMHIYMTSYQSVRKRLVEASIITEEGEQVLIDKEDSVQNHINAFSQELNTILDRPTRKKTIPGLRDLIEEVEERKLLDEYAICKMKYDFGISDLDDTKATINILTEDKKDGED